MGYLRIGVFLGVAAMLLVATATGGAAQQSKQTKSQANERPAGLGWTKLCGKIAVADQPEGASKTKVDVCRVFRERLNPATGSRLMAVGIELRSDRKARTLRVTVPLGANLRSGVQTSIDGGQPITLSYENCTVRGCTATIEITPQTVNALKSGQQLVVTGAGPRRKPISVALSLAGFTAAYDGPPGDAKAYKERRAKMVQGIQAARAARVDKALKTLRSQEQARPQAQPQPQLGGPPLEVEIQPY